MSQFFIIVSAILTPLVAYVVVALARRMPAAAHLARIILPVAAVTLIAQMALRHWSIAAFLLLAVMIISAGALAVRGPGREHAPTWIALAIFAATGLAGGFGMLTEGLCLAGDTYGCGGVGSDALAIVGWLVAWTAYGYLGWSALRR